MRTKYRVKATYRATRWYPWLVSCEGCGMSPLCFRSLYAANSRAIAHAALCKELHWRNWDAACPSCKSYGKVARACPVCLGYGFEREREGLE